MGSLDELNGSLIFIDTAPIMYFVERHPRYLDVVRSIFQALERNELSGITSTLTLAEVLVQPLRRSDRELAEQYRSILTNANGMELAPVTSQIAEVAAHIRAEHRVKIPDAVQLATCIYRGATLFLTNDLALPKIAGIKLIVLDELVAGGG